MSTAMVRTFEPELASNKDDFNVAISSGRQLGAKSVLSVTRVKLTYVSAATRMQVAYAPHFHDKDKQV
jgi:hypothetical protein